MKKIFTSILAIVLVFTLLTTGVSAFTFEMLEQEDVYEPDLIEKEKISSWAESELEKARSAGLITPSTTYYMTRATTRFQFAELIVNMVEKVTGKTIEAAPSDTFTDCSEEAILKAYSAGIVSGIGNNLFAPDKNTNRQEIATMIYRAILYIKEQTGTDLTPAAADLTGFTDKDQVASWALEGVGRLAANDIMKGTSTTKLSPADSCTVEQCIILVYRVYQKI